MTPDQQQKLHQLIMEQVEPITGQSLAELGADVQCSDDSIEITLGYFNVAWIARLQQTIQRQLNVFGADIDINVRCLAPDYLGDEVAARLQPVRTIIAVASGKGGVGKSATAVNLALALKAEGARVGIVDADVYGPSVPTMLGVTQEQVGVTEQNAMLPVFSQGIVCNSIGFLMKEDDAAIWRGPMAAAAMTQLFEETEWPELDYLVVDMPPGTGDIQLTLAQKIPVSTAVVVTTPQNLALADARRGVVMFEKVKVPVCGVAENMSYYRCEACGHENDIFGDEGGARLAEEAGVPLVARIPLNREIREQADSGVPTVAHDPDGALAEEYRMLAKRVGAFLWSRFRSHGEDVQTIKL